MDRPISTGWLMYLSHRAAEDRIYAALAEAGFGDITRAQGRLLAGIDLDGTRLGVLAERARIPKQTAVALVNGLEASGYVERLPDPSDGRARLVRLTGKGLAALPFAVAEEGRIESDWKRLIGERRLDALRATLWDLALASDPELEPESTGKE